MLAYVCALIGGVKPWSPQWVWNPFSHHHIKLNPIVLCMSACNLVQHSQSMEPSSWALDESDLPWGGFVNSSTSCPLCQFTIRCIGHYQLKDNGVCVRWKASTTLLVSPIIARFASKLPPAGGEVSFRNHGMQTYNRGGRLRWMCRSGVYHSRPRTNPAK